MYSPSHSAGLAKQEKFITSVEEMKTVHNEYNNLYYWSNDFINEGQSRPQTATVVEKLENLIDAESWLEDNLWRYYD